MEVKDAVAIVGLCIAVPGGLYGLYNLWNAWSQHVLLRFKQRRFTLPEGVVDIVAPFGRTPVSEAMSEDQRDLFSALAKAGYLVTVQVTNNTNATLSGATIVPGDRNKIRVAHVKRPGEPLELVLPTGRLALGDIKPRTTVDLVLWTDLSAFVFPEDFQFHADQGARRRYKVHDPESGFHYYFRVNKIILAIIPFPLFFILLIIALVTKR